MSNELMTALLDGGFLGTTLRNLDLEGGRTWRMPAVDIEADDKEYVFTAEMPGMEKEQFGVQVHEGLLIIRGERKVEETKKERHFVRREMSYGAFSRTFTLPEDAKGDKVQATYKNGILRIAVPRAEKTPPKQVDIRVE